MQASGKRIQNGLFCRSSGTGIDVGKIPSKDATDRNKRATRVKIDFFIRFRVDNVIKTQK